MLVVIITGDDEIGGFGLFRGYDWNQQQKVGF